MSGLFIISLDFELFWGRCDKIEFNATVQKRLLNTRALIPELLKIFTASDLHATWACVGMLFNDTPSQWVNNRPHELPTFQNPERSVYNYFNPEKIELNAYSYYFAPDLIQLIKGTSGQEVGTHTYAHFPCLEVGGTTVQFSADIDQAKRVASNFNISLQSMVFPRNQYSDEHLRICADQGIKVVRTNPPLWFWSPTNTENYSRRIARFSDTHNILAPKKTYPLDRISVGKSGFPILLPACRLFVPWRLNLSILNHLKLTRILDEMTHAAKKGLYYHLWWHPENFGDHPQACLHEMQVIANHYKYLKNKYNFKSFTMLETAEIFS